MEDLICPECKSQQIMEDPTDNTFYICLDCKIRDDKYKFSINQKGLKHDSGKLLMSLIEPEYIEDIASVLTFGAEKYAPNSWQKVDDAERRYKDALLRHTMSYLKGEHLDPESGLTHLSHMATNIMFLSHFSRNLNNTPSELTYEEHKKAKCDLCEFNRDSSDDYIAVCRDCEYY